MHNQTRRTLARAALVAIGAFPFIVGIAPPDTFGTFISFSGGGGRSSYTTSSCGYTNHVRSSFYNTAMAVDHRVNMKKEGSSKGSALSPRYLSIGISGNYGVGRTYEFMTNDESNTGERFNEYRDQWNQMDFGARVGIDWRNFGMTAGAVQLEDQIFPSFAAWVGTPVVYYSLSVIDQPISLNAVGETGIGINAKKLHLWYGLSLPYGGNLSPTLKLGRNFESGTVGVTLLGAPWGDGRPDYGGSLFAQYKLPFF